MIFKQHVICGQHLLQFFSSPDSASESKPLNNTGTQRWRPALSPPQSSSCSVIRAHAGHSYLFQAAHEVVANRWPRKVGSAGASAHVEEIIRAQHGVVFLRVAGGGEDPIDGDGHLSGANT